MTLDSIIEALRMDANFMANVAAWERFPAREAKLAPFPGALDGRLRSALEESGTGVLYAHQAQAVEAALGGQNVVIVTGTASGKTLCYNLPVLQTWLHNPEARALYLFPTKALAHDQTEALLDLCDHLDERPAVRPYDGDTPSGKRSAFRREGRILLSNPDMLHQGILPYHTRWGDFFANLRWVVLDELHTYRGVFGSHVANVIRRLKRICAFYDNAPRFICTSATIANPLAHAERLAGEAFALVDEDGAPQGEKHVIIYNPPVINAELNIRASYTQEAAGVAGKFLAGDVQTILFARTRLTTELLLGYVRDSVGGAVRGYRGGYLPLERREIERGLRAGEIRGVVATNALELGIDIGELGAAVLAGYPGTIASAWQQAGRAGRRTDRSAAVLVASSQPLDQYIARNPRFLFERSPENALINPDNLAILTQHVLAAAYELPFAPSESFGNYAHTANLIEALAESGLLHVSGGAARYVRPEAPSHAVSLRTGTTDRVIIQAQNGTGEPRVIGEIDRERAPMAVYPGAVYLHEGESYLIEALDWENGLAQARPERVDYFTVASGGSAVEVLDVYESDAIGDVVKAHGRLMVTQEVTGYRIVKRYTNETLGYGEIDLPPRRFETTGYWIALTPELAERLMDAGVLKAPNDYGPNWARQRDAARSRDNYRCQSCSAPERFDRHHDVHHIRPFRTFDYIRGVNDAYLEANRLENLVTLCPTCHRAAESAIRTRSALSGMAYALHNLAAIYLMSEPDDLGRVVEQKSTHTKAPTVTFYDNLPDGLGFSERLYGLHDEMLSAALEQIDACPCASGCPACVGPVSEVDAETKALTIELLHAILKPDEPA